MKRFLAIALVAVFVLGMAATAMAANLEVTGNGSGINVTGEYRFRGISTNNTSDFSDDADDRNNYMNQRLRIKLDAIVGDDVQVKTRFTVSDGEFNGANDTGTPSGAGDTVVCDDGGTPTDPTDDVCPIVDVYTTGTDSAIQTDHAYLVIKKFGGAITIGRQPASWGNGFWSWGSIKDRIKYVTKVNDMITVGAFAQKDKETHNVTGGGDKDSYAVLAIVKPADDQKVSVIYVNTNDSSVADDNTITTIDVAYSGKLGPLGAMAEYVTSDDDSDLDATTGLLVAAGMDVMEGLNVALGYAAATNGWTADDDFGPVLSVGTAVNATAIGQFGGLQDARGNDDSASTIALMVKYKMSDDVTLGLNGASHVLSDNNDANATEIDLYANYALATRTSLTAAYVMITPDGDAFGTTTDDITSAAVQIKTTF